MSGVFRHPATRFKAPSTIVAGSPLKELIGRPLVRLLTESLAHVQPGFRKDAFERDATERLETRSFSERGEHLARSMHRYLPQDFGKAAKILIASMGPELVETEGNGLAPFFYFPHAYYIALFGGETFENAMRANYELTKRFTAEFSVRPFLIRYPAQTLARLRRWAKDPNPHVRRAVSEGTRPRLPWASRLPEFQRDPAPVLGLLELLKDDPSLYVRRSVANNLGDIAKDHPNEVYRTGRRWLEESSGADEDRRKAICWVIRHAVRLPAKNGVAEALRLQREARA